MHSQRAALRWLDLEAQARTETHISAFHLRIFQINWFEWVTNNVFVTQIKRLSPIAPSPLAWTYTYVRWLESDGPSLRRTDQRQECITSYLLKGVCKWDIWPMDMTLEMC